MSRRVGISVSAGAAIICSLTGSESCTSNACPCVCWQEASLTRPTGPSLHTAAHSMVFSSEWSGEGEHAQDGSHRCRTVILSLLLFTVGPTRQLWSSVGGYIMEAWLLRVGGWLPPSAPQPAGVPVLSPCTGRDMSHSMTVSSLSPERHHLSQVQL